MNGIHRSVALFLLTGGLVSAQDLPACPEVQFAVGYAVNTYVASGTNAHHSVFLRNPDGSLNDVRFQPYSPFKKLSETPSGEAQLWNCTGLPARPFAGRGDGNPAKFGQEPQGVGSRLTRTIDLGGGRVLVVSVNDRAARNKLITVRVKPDRTIEQQVNYDTPANPNGLVIGDFNKDGITDVAVTSTGEYNKTSPVISVYPGAADGSFGARIDTPLAALAVQIAAGDFNGDGNLDLAATDASNFRVAVLLGKGDGSFAAAVNYKSTGYESAVAVADLNGDGRLDILLGPSQNGVNYLPGNGDGTFRSAVLVAAGGTARYIGVGDFNEDGRLDVVFTDFDASAVRVFLAQANGTFAQGGLSLAGYSPLDFVVSDLDLDGHLDVLLGATDPSALNRGDLSSLFVAMFGRGDGTLTGAQMTTLPQGVQSMAVADLNGDGLADVVVGGSRGSIQVLLGQADGSLAAPKAIAGVSSGTVSELLVADFNLDGKLDLAAALDGTQSVAVLPGRGDGTFGAAVTLALPGIPQALASGDFNGDRRPDLAVASAASSYSPPSNVSLFLSNASGGFAAARTTTTGQMVRSLVAGDFNKDGKVDLVAGDYGNPSVSTPNGGVLLLAGDGAGGLQPAATLLKDFQTAALVAADLNGDGTPDLVASGMGLNFAFRVFVLTGKAEGGFGEPVPVVTDYGPSRLVVGDFSGDGIPDVAVAHCCGDTYVGVHVGNGDGTLKPETLVEMAASPSRVAAADVDADGRMDLLVSFQSYASSGTLAVLRNATKRVNVLKLANGASGAAATSAAVGSLVSGLGKSLATGDEVGDLSALPSTMGGASVKVVDSAGVESAALLYSVSRDAVRFVMPAAASGTAVVTVTGADGQSWVGSLEVTGVSPGMFSVNQAGTAQGYLVRELADGSASAEEFTRTNPDTGALEPIDIDMGAEDTKIYLVLYCTGLRGVSSLAAMSATAAGEAAAVTDVHANDNIPALDEARLLLPRSLVGKGEVEIRLTADGVTSNGVKIRVQ